MSEPRKEELPQIVEPGIQQQQQIAKTIKSAYLKYLLCAIPCCVLVMIGIIIIGFLVMRLW